jgi:hypothetical protein
MLDSAKRKLPTRLLEIIPLEGLPTVRLVETRMVPVETEYLTLSHCVSKVSHSIMAWF